MTMDHNLEIALVSGALAVAWGYNLRLRLHEGYTKIIVRLITKAENPRAFWTIMLLLALIEAGFVALAVVHVAFWLSRSRP